MFLAGGLAALFLGDGILFFDLALGLGVVLGHFLNGEGVNNRARTVAFEEPCGGAAEDVAASRNDELPRSEQLRARSAGDSTWERG